MNLLVVTELHEEVQLMTHFGVIRAEDSEIDFEFLFDSFCFSTGLGVIGSASKCFYFKKSHYFVEYL